MSKKILLAITVLALTGCFSSQNEPKKVDNDFIVMSIATIRISDIIVFMYDADEDEATLILNSKGGPVTLKLAMPQKDYDLYQNEILKRSCKNE